MYNQYIGDGVYVDFDGYQLKLYTDRGPDGIHEVYLEPSVYENLVAFVDNLKNEG